MVDKPSAPGSFCIIQDFSFQTGSNTPPLLNLQINPKDFACVWGFFDNIVQAVLAALPRTKAATFDVDAAYRQIPVIPEDQSHTIFHWRDNFYVDGCVPFGAASSNGLFARCSDTMVLFYTKQNFGIILKWVDNFLFIQHPHDSGASISPANTFFNQRDLQF